MGGDAVMRLNVISRRMRTEWLRSWRIALSIVGGLLCLSGAIVLSGCRQEEGRRTVRTRDDLPRHTYPVRQSVKGLFADREALAELAARVRADLTDDLSKHEIKDQAALAQLHQVLVNAAIVDGDLEEGLAQIEQVRQLEVTDRAKLLAGFPLEAIVKARAEGRDNEAKFRELVARNLREQLDAMPWDKMGDDIMQYKGSAEIMSKAYLVGNMLEQMDSVLPAMDGKLSFQMAAALLGAWVKVKLVLPVKSELSSACGLVIRERRVATKNVWADRSVALDSSENLTPVVVAIWDSGVDTSIFEGRLWVNGKEALDGVDNDGNGFVDDVNGIAHGLYGDKLKDLMRSADSMSVSSDEAERRLRGYLDIHRALDTDNAEYVRTVVQGLDHAGMNAFLEDVYFYDAWAHGTHVASIAAEGNPFIRLLVVRADYHTDPFYPTIETAHRHSAAQKATVDYCRQAGVRVVNMSWSEARGVIELYIERSMGGGSAKERATLARDFFQIISGSLYEAIRDAPDILFVTSAGNLRGDVKFDELIPAVFDLPNLIAVGAVDQAGRPAEMNSYGEQVKFFANGADVQGLVPGGGGMKISGTSVASPGLVNLAAKLLAIDPSLTTSQLIRVIKEGADRLEGDRSMLVINPVRTVEALRKKIG